MNNEQLEQVFRKLTKDIEGSSGRWQFIVYDVQIVCLTDTLHNRMRIMAPIKKHEEMTSDEYKRCMQANFHSALDVKYAISEDLLWVVFMHPLQELTQSQAEDAVQQVYSAVKTYGSTYSSSNLYFPTDEDRRNQMN